MSLPSRLLVLELRGELVFPENLAIGACSGGFFPAGPQPEGGEELHELAETAFLEGVEGPRCPALLPPPLRSWLRRAGAVSDGEASGATARKGGGSGPTPGGDVGTGEGGRLGAGLWLFSQFRPEGPAELSAGLEWFLREAWWERRSLEGPPYLRLVREDGALAFQLLRRLTRAPAG